MFITSKYMIVMMFESFKDSKGRLSKLISRYHTASKTAPSTHVQIIIGKSNFQCFDFVLFGNVQSLDFWIFVFFVFLDFWIFRFFWFLDFWIFLFLDLWVVGAKVNEIGERSFTFQKKVSTVVDFGMSWSHLSAFGHTFLDKCHTSQRLGLLLLKSHRCPYDFNDFCSKNPKIQKSKNQNCCFLVFWIFGFLGFLVRRGVITCERSPRV